MLLLLPLPLSACSVSLLSWVASPAFGADANTLQPGCWHLLPWANCRETMLAAGGFWGSSIQFCQPADRPAHLPPCRAGRAGPGSFVSCRTAPHYLRFWPLDCFAGMCGHATTFAWVPSKTSLDVCCNTGYEGLLCRDLLCPPVTDLGVLSGEGTLYWQQCQQAGREQASNGMVLSVWAHDIHDGKA